MLKKVYLFLVIIMVLGFAQIARASEIPEEEVPPVVEETEIPGCTDPEANNFNPEANRFDESCTYDEVVEVVTEDTDELCHDLQDNDGDESTDEADADCAPFFTPEEVIVVPENDNNDSNNRSSRRSGSRRSESSSNQGEVLGASTDTVCDALPYITSYLRMGQDNNVEDVKRLQIFLNEHMNLSIPVTGFFGPLTEAGVNAFQLRYKEDILKPWVDAGFHSSDSVPTGYVYKTTLWKIHSLMCADVMIPKPELN